MADVDNKGCPVDTDADGIPDYIDECPDSTPGENVDKNGCPKVEEIPLPDHQKLPKLAK